MPNPVADLEMGDPAQPAVAPKKLALGPQVPRPVADQAMRMAGRDSMAQHRHL
jgi:hypothetical protein